MATTVKKRRYRETETLFQFRGIVKVASLYKYSVALLATNLRLFINIAQRETTSAFLGRLRRRDNG